jgi:hypothetical protein
MNATKSIESQFHKERVCSFKCQAKGLWWRVNLDGLGEGGKANLGVSDIEYGVVVGHEGVAQDPELAADARVRDDAANAVGGA